MAMDAQRRLLLACGLLAASGLHAQTAATPLAPLLQWLREVRSARANFRQEVLSPARASVAARRRVSSGTLAFARPGRLRMAYRQPFEQTLVADGQTLWWHDPDLQQVTARPQAQALAGTPAGLLTAAPDAAALQADFDWQTEPDAEGLQWLAARPRQADSPVALLRVGLRSAGALPEWAVLEVRDRFGQTTLLRLSDWQLNPALPPDTFAFVPPAGTSVIRP
jgi:outer membrane lipoprotein carrier protein